MGPSFSNKKSTLYERKSLERKSLRCHKSAPLSCSMVHAAFQSMHAATGLFICTFAHMHGTPTHSLPVPWLGSLLLKSVKKLLLSQMDCVCFTSLVLMDRLPSTFHEQQDGCTHVLYTESHIPFLIACRYLYCLSTLYIDLRKNYIFFSSFPSSPSFTFAIHETLRPGGLCSNMLAARPCRTAGPCRLHARIYRSERMQQRRSPC